jgi:hypothetical protein
MNRISVEKNRERLWSEKGWADSLHSFAKNGDYTSLRAILPTVDIFEEDENGETALQIAERQLENYQKCVDLLRKKEKECYEFDENLLEREILNSSEKNISNIFGSSFLEFCSGNFLKRGDNNMNVIISTSKENSNIISSSPIEIIELPTSEETTNCLST